VQADTLRGAKAVVLGGAGFIGSHIVDQLRETDVAQIVVFDNFTRGLPENLAAARRDSRVRVVVGDIEHRDVLDAALEGAACVFHLAALWLLHCQDFPRAAFQVNVEGTLNVLEACRDRGVKRLVFSSSASVYGDAVEIPMDEEHPLHNRTFYGATKIAGEQMCTAFAERFGLPFVGLRYMNVYGPRQPAHGAYTGVAIRMLERLSAGASPVVYGDGKQVLDFVHVRDVARANLAAAATPHVNEFYNVGSGVGTSILELAQRLVSLEGSRNPVVFQPAPSLGVTRRVADTKRAREKLGFEATIGLEEGLRDLVLWWNSYRAAREKDACDPAASTSIR